MKKVRVSLTRHHQRPSRRSKYCFETWAFLSVLLIFSIQLWLELTDIEAHLEQREEDEKAVQKYNEESDEVARVVPRGNEERKDRPKVKIFPHSLDEENVLMPDALKRQWERIKQKNVKHEKHKSIYDLDGDGFEDREQCVGIHQKIKGMNIHSV